LTDFKVHVTWLTHAAAKVKHLILDILDFLLLQQNKTYVIQQNAVWHIRRIVDSDYEPRHVCLLVCPHGTTQLPFQRFFMKFDI
jgi:hypothetical protein